MSVKSMKNGRTSWQAKLDRVQEWKIVDGGNRFHGNLLIPTPRQIESLVREIPLGAVSNPKLMRATLAKRLGADHTCPLCMGIFLRIAAEACEESARLGLTRHTPYWRVVDQKGKHFPKWPGGTDGQKAILDQELKDLMG